MRRTHQNERRANRRARHDDLLGSVHHVHRASGVGELDARGALVSVEQHAAALRVQHNVQIGSMQIGLTFFLQVSV